MYSVRGDLQKRGLLSKKNLANKNQLVLDADVMNRAEQSMDKRIEKHQTA